MHTASLSGSMSTASTRAPARPMWRAIEVPMPPPPAPITITVEPARPHTSTPSPKPVAPLVGSAISEVLVQGGLGDGAAPATGGPVAAVDVKGGAADEAGEVAGQEEGGRGGVLGGAEEAEGRGAMLA